MKNLSLSLVAVIVFTLPSIAQPGPDHRPAERSYHYHSQRGHGSNVVVINRPGPRVVVVSADQNRKACRRQAKRGNGHHHCNCHH